ncbi:MAG: hypothetical protein ABIF10_06795 [Candidatus Woesearchaeota archaeon]
MASGIRVKCKACGRLSDSSEFVLDPGYKMMVCQNCVKERRMREEVKSKVQEQKAEKKKPKGWDIEDEELERLYTAKQYKKAQVVRLDQNRAKYKCAKCAYEFIIKLDKMLPNRCPYCSADIAKF